MNEANGWLDIALKILEGISFVAVTALTVVSIYGLRQLRLTKKTLKTQSLRDARKLSAEYVYQYLDRIVNYDGDPVEVSANERKALESIVFSDDESTEYLDIEKTKGHDPSLKLTTIKSRKAFVEKVTNAASSYGGLLNELEAFAAVVTSGVLDEPSVYRAVGRNYVTLIKSENLEEFLKVHKSSRHYYINVIELYELWSKRQEVEDMEKNLGSVEKANIESIKEIKRLRESIGKIQGATIQSIGVDDIDR